MMKVYEHPVPRMEPPAVPAVIQDTPCTAKNYSVLVKNEVPFACGASKNLVMGSGGVSPCFAKKELVSADECLW